MNKYDVIYQDLRQSILNKSLRPGDRLPTEEALAQAYQVSRETVRKAQSMLVDAGFIHKKQRRGSVVLDVDQLQISGSGLHSFAELLHDKALVTHTQVLSNQSGELPDAAAERYGLVPKEPVIILERLRFINNEAVMYDRDYFFQKWVPTIPDSVAQGSVYAWLEYDLCLPIAYATKEITVELASESDRKRLDLHQHSHLVVIRSAISLDDAQIFQVHETHQRADTFRFVDFATRQSGVK